MAPILGIKKTLSCFPKGQNQIIETNIMKNLGFFLIFLVFINILIIEDFDNHTCLIRKAFLFCFHWAAPGT